MTSYLRFAEGRGSCAGCGVTSDTGTAKLFALFIHDHYYHER